MNSEINDKMGGEMDGKMAWAVWKSVSCSEPSHVSEGVTRDFVLKQNEPFLNDNGHHFKVQCTKFQCQAGCKVKKSIKRMSALKPHMNADVCTRLYLTPTHTVKVTEEDTDALISDLPTDTLKWIKKHRRLDCDAKIVLSHNRERQLRDIFNGIDVGKNGSIDLIELEEAVSFVKERLEKKFGTFAGFNQIIKVFKSMDVNGDGKVDFREFTNAMTGSTKSALAKASEDEVANLHRCFLEFGVLKARRVLPVVMIPTRFPT